MAKDLSIAAVRQRLREGKQWAKALRKGRVVFRNLPMDEQKRFWELAMLSYNKRRRNRAGTVSFNVKTLAFKRMLRKKEGDYAKEGVHN